MRVLLFTGKGGVGKSTVAAATAVAAARSGRRTLVLSTDAAHSLADALDVEAGSEPTPVGGGLFAQQVDVQRRFEESWEQVRDYLRGVADAAGVDPLLAEELTVLPGAEEVLALLELRRQARSGDWDAVVVDCAPTAETLRLLQLPEALGWYVRRVLAGEHRLARSLAPVLARVTGVPLPQRPVLDAIERVHRELGEVRELLVGPESSVRLVLTPEQVVCAETRRAWTALSLFGYAVDGVVANRVFPDAPGDEWRSGWVRAQARVLQEVSDSFAGLPLWRAEYAGAEPVGVPALAALAERLYGVTDPLDRSGVAPPFRVDPHPGGAVLSLHLPHADTDRVGLGRHGGDLVVSLDSHRRVLSLPAALTQGRVTGARVVDGRLQVRFEGVRA